MGQARSRAGTGLEPKLAGLLCYLLGWISGLAFLILEEDKFIRFHAIQSIVTFGALSLLFTLVLVPVIGWVFGWSSIIAAFILWIILMIRAYRGEKPRMPIAGKFAEKMA